MGDLLANQSGSLLPQRMRCVQYDPFDMSGVLASSNAPFRPEELAESPASMPFSNTTALQPSLIPSSTMIPGDLFNSASNLGSNAAFYNPYGLLHNSMGANASFGSFYWPAVMPPVPRDSNYICGAPGQHIKMEHESPTLPSQLDFDNIASGSPPDYSSTYESSDDTKPAVFNTDIDTLMRAIQSKHQPEQQQTQQQSSLPNSRPSSNTTTTTTISPPNRTRSPPKEQHKCPTPNCPKSFRQKTHLAIHARVHSGLKPFPCPEPTCSARFSQLGNLKTHSRRHTGERPYSCEICGKAFAQHGNVRAHRVVHSGSKPYECKLDDCGKQFTQLGNLKSHQNKFHGATIRRLKDLFENVGVDVVEAGGDGGGRMEEWERGMWEYFRGLYKHCNQGIKGRGKERRGVGGGGNDGFDVSPSSSSSSSIGVFGKRRDSLTMMGSDASSWGWS